MLIAYHYYLVLAFVGVCKLLDPALVDAFVGSILHDEQREIVSLKNCSYV